MATLWERTPQRLPPAEPLPLRGDSSEGFQGFFSEFCSEKATSSPVFMRELPTASRSSLRRVPRLSVGSGGRETFREVRSLTEKCMVARGYSKVPAQP